MKKYRIKGHCYHEGYNFDSDDIIGAEDIKSAIDKAEDKYHSNYTSITIYYAVEVECVVEKESYKEEMQSARW